MYVDILNFHEYSNYVQFYIQIKVTSMKAVICYP